METSCLIVVSKKRPPNLALLLFVPARKSGPPTAILKSAFPSCDNVSSAELKWESNSCGKFKLPAMIPISQSSCLNPQ